MLGELFFRKKEGRPFCLPSLRYFCVGVDLLPPPVPFLALPNNFLLPSYPSLPPPPPSAAAFSPSLPSVSDARPKLLILGLQIKHA